MTPPAEPPMADPMSLDDTIALCETYSPGDKGAANALHWLTTFKAQLDVIANRINRATRLCADNDDMDVAIEHLEVFVQDADSVKAERDRFAEQIRKLKEALEMSRVHFTGREREYVEALLNETESDE